MKFSEEHKVVCPHANEDTVEKLTSDIFPLKVIRIVCYV